MKAAALDESQVMIPVESEASLEGIFDLSTRTFQESAVELLPLSGQLVTFDDDLKLRPIYRALLDKLQHAVVIPGASGAK
jgi:hypothetical protein